jgi:8-oxo-dGTP diphosphatase/A/G-specific adenine glycosylase
LNPTVEIALALIHRDGELLVARRARGPLAGLWEFPGGKIEAGESVEAAARRECAEELGVEVESGVVLRVVEHAYPDLTVRLHPVLCRLQEGSSPRPLDATALAWAHPAELAAWDIPAPNHSILAQLSGLAL